MTSFSAWGMHFSPCWLDSQEELSLRVSMKNGSAQKLPLRRLDPEFVRAITKGKSSRHGLAIRVRVRYLVDMRILVVGDRFWTGRKLARDILERLVARHGPDIVVIHDGGPGVADSFARECRELGLETEYKPPDWAGLGNIGRSARYKQMIASGADLCIAVRRSIAESKGTKDCVRQALAAGISTFLISNEQAVPRRLQADDKRIA